MGYPSFKLHQPLFLSGCDNHTVRSQGDCRLPRRDRTSVSLAAQSSHTIELQGKPIRIDLGQYKRRIEYRLSVF